MKKNIYKCVLKILFAVIVASLNLVNLWAESTAPKKVRVAYFESKNFQEGVTPGAEKKGLSYEYLQRIADYTGWEYDFVYGDWSDLYKLFLNGKIDIFPALTFTEERYKLMEYPDLYMDTEHHSIFVRKDDKTMSADDIKSFDGKKIGCIKNNNVTNDLLKWKASTGAKIELVYFSDYSQLKEEIQKGTIDGFTCSTNSITTSDNVIPLLQIAFSQVYLCVRKNAIDILDELNFAQIKIQREEPYLLAGLKAKYYKNLAVNEVFSQHEEDWIENHKFLNVGYLNNYMPFSGTSDNSVDGFVKDLFSEILKNLKLDNDISIRYTGYASQNEMVKALKDGKVEVAFPIVGDRNTLNAYGITCSAEVLDVPLYVAFKGNYNEETFSRVAINARPGQKIGELYKNKEIYYLDNPEDCLDYVLNGKATCTILASYKLKYMLSNRKFRKIKTYTFGENRPFCVGVNRGESELISILNKGIILSEQAVFTDSIFKYLQANTKYSLINLIQDNILLFILILGIIGGVIVCILLLYTASIKKHKRETDLLNEQLQENQMKLEESVSEQEAQIEEISALNENLQENQAKLEEATAEQEAQLEEITALNTEIQETNDRLIAASGIIEGLSQEYHTVWLVDRETLKMTLIRSNASAVVKEAVQKGLETANYWETCLYYIENYVMEIDKERMLKEVSPEVVCNEIDKSKNIYSVNYLRRASDGSISYHQMGFVDASSDNNKTNFVLGFRDVDAVVQAELASRERLVAQQERERRQLETIAEATNGGFKISKNDKDYTLTYVSDGLANMLGYTLEEFMKASDRKMTQVVNLEDAHAEVPKVKKAVDAGEMYTMNYRMRCKDGSWKNVQDRGRLIYNAEGEGEFWCFISDKDELIEKTKALELAETANKALIESQAALESARVIAEAANKAKTTFLNNMSHDIRTPMNAIVGFTNLMKEEINNPEVLSSYIEKIKISSDYLLSLINNVLDMARIDSGKTDLDETVYDLKDEKNNILAIFEKEIKNNNLTVDHNINVEHRYFYGDELKIRQIWLNLFSNAVKYTPKGGHIRIDTVELPCEKEGYATYCTELEDNGIGIGKDYLPKIFDSFSRERNSTESKISGTGLGMPIVKKLVDLMGGKIEVESEPGKGTKITVTVTHKIAEQPEIKKYVAENEKESKIDLRDKNILLAEDNELNAEIATAILEGLGAKVDVAQDGIICVDKLEKAESGYYSVVLMDIQMPNMDGLYATGLIRNFADKTKANIPVIAMTANAFEEDKKKVEKVGMNGYVAKPIDVKDLMSELAKVLK